MNAVRIGKWIVAGDNGAFQTLDLMCRGACVETFEVTEGISEEDAHELAIDVLRSAEEHSENEGKVSTYAIVGRLASGESVRCPIRVRPAHTTSKEITKTLFAQNQELHRLLLESRAEERRDRELLVKQNAIYAKAHVETLELLHKLRTDDLRLQIEKEEHEQSKERNERLVNAAVPLLTGIGNKLLGANNDIAVLTEIVKSLTEEQVNDILRVIPDELHSDFATLCECALDKRANLAQCKAFLGKLTQEQTMGLMGVLNVGQQGALTSLISEGPKPL